MKMSARKRRSPKKKESTLEGPNGKIKEGILGEAPSWTIDGVV